MGETGALCASAGRAYGDGSCLAAGLVVVLDVEGRGRTGSVKEWKTVSAR